MVARRRDENPVPAGGCREILPARFTAFDGRAQLIDHVRLLQPAQSSRAPAVMVAPRQRRAQRGAACGVRIGVLRHRDTARACRGERAQRLFRASPVFRTRGLVMRDVDAPAAALADAHDLLDARNDVVALVAHVAGEDVLWTERRGQRHELVEFGEHAGRIDQAGRDAERAGVERLI